MGVHRAWVCTVHGCAPCMGVHRAWLCIVHGCASLFLAMNASSSTVFVEMNGYKITVAVDYNNSIRNELKNIK